MRALNPAAAKFSLSALTQEAMSCAKEEGGRWIFVAKSVAASLLALWLSMRFQLEQPRLAMITVFIVMRPQTGMVLTKSVYRILGILAGVLVSILLTALFAQEPVLFLLGLALWVGICTAGAAFYRDFKSYGWVLAGYSAALASLAAAPQPDAAFSFAVTRLSEVTLGVLCAGLFSDLFFPRRLSDQITANVRRRYCDFMLYVRSSLSGSASRRELEAMQHKLVGEVLALESIRGAATLEDPEVRSRDQKLRRLNSEFMAASTSFHSFHRLLERLTRNSTFAGKALLEIYDALGAELERTGASPKSSAAARGSARRIALFRAMLSRKVAAAKRRHPELGEPENTTDFETAVELLQRFLRELYAYTKSYADLPVQETGPQPPDDISFATHTDPVAALLAGVKAFVAIVATSIFWIATAWPYGASALCFVAVTSALFGSAPDQYRAVRHMTIGHGSGYLAAVLFMCLVVPWLDGFMLLAAALVPMLMIGSYIITYPRWIAIGTGYVVFFCAMLSPANPMLFNLLGVINEGLAALLGTAITGVVFMTLVPATGAWSRRRTASQIRRQVVIACFHPLPGLVNRFEGGTAELMHQIDSTRHLHPDRNQRLIAWIFTVKEIGRAVIDARQDAISVELRGPLSERLQESIEATARLFTRPSGRRFDQALGAVTLAIDSIRDKAELAPPQESEKLRRLLASLHLIRTALLDAETAIGAAFGTPTGQFTEEIVNAA